MNRVATDLLATGCVKAGNARTFGHSQHDAASKWVKGRLALPANASARIVLVGHSFGGDTAIEVAEGRGGLFPNPYLSNHTIHRLVQVDSVGIGDEVLPNNVTGGLNIWQTSTGFSYLTEPEGASVVKRSTNVHAETHFGVANTAITHTNIDDFPTNVGDPNVRGLLVKYVLFGTLPVGAGVTAPVAAAFNPQFQGLAAISPSSLPGTSWDSGVLSLNPPVILSANESVYVHVDFGGALLFDSLADLDGPSTEIVSMDLIGSVMSGPSDDIDVEVQLDGASDSDQVDQLESTFVMSGGGVSGVLESVNSDFIDGSVVAPDGITIEIAQDEDGEIEISALRVVIQADTITQAPVGGAIELLTSDGASSTGAERFATGAAAAVVAALTAAAWFVWRREWRREARR